MIIREARENDLQAMSRLMQTLAQKYIVHEFGREGREAILHTMCADALAKNMCEGFAYHVAEIDGAISGVIGMKDNAHLYHLFVADAYARKGIATALWRHASTVCIDRGNAGEFSVNASRYAQPLYAKLGFVEVSGPMERNGVTYIPMKLTLRPT